MKLLFCNALRHLPPLCLLMATQNAFTALNETNLFPPNGAANVCPDTPLKIAFDAPPKVNSTGLIHIYTAAGVLADTLDMSASSQTRVIGGVTFTNFAVITNGNTASIFPHPATLTTNQTYYVNIDATVFSNPGSGAFAGIASTNGWRFTTKPALPPTGTNYLVVAADGSGDFATVQGAVDFLPASNPKRVLVFIRKGTYQEIIHINAKTNITLRGEDRKQTVLVYANNNALNGGTYRPSFNLDANDVALENLTVTNSTPKGGGQAETVRNSGTHCILFNADFDSYQDTLRLDGSIYIENCYVQGDTDFIWGYGAAYFTNSETKAMNQGYNCQCRNPANIYGEVFVNCKLTKASSFTGHYLNRTDSKVTSNGDSNVCVMYLNCQMDTHIPATGWTNQFPSGVGTAGLRLWEYKSTALGTTNLLDTSQRMSYSRQLSDAEAALYVRPANIFGTISNNLPVGDGWIPQLAPNILAAPTNQTVNTNQIAAFVVSATGIPAPQMQWQKNGANIFGATNTTFTVTNCQPADTGIYSVIVSNAAASVTNGATLIVNPIAPPTLGASVSSGGQFQFAVNCFAGLNYTILTSSNLVQWQQIFVTNPQTAIFNWTDSTASNFPARYYRVQAAAPP